VSVLPPQSQDRPETVQAGGGKVAKRIFPELDVFKVTTEYSPRTGQAEPQVKIGFPLGDKTRIDASRGLTLERDFDAKLRYELGRQMSLELEYQRDPDNFAGDLGGNFRVYYEF